MTNFKKLIIIKISIIIVLVVIFSPIIPTETQIQCITTPCNPIIENKSIIQVLQEFNEAEGILNLLSQEFS